MVLKGSCNLVGDNNSNKNKLPFLFILITEVEKARGMKNQFHKVMRHQQN